METSIILNQRPMRLGVAFLCVFAFSGLLAGNRVSAQTRAPESLQLQQREQERARAMAAELVSGVLDVQLRQLEENQLQKLPIYSEIKLMRQNIGQLVDDQMHNVVDLLVKAERERGADREKVIQEARAEIRVVVVALMAERQRLYKRMRLARLAAQLRQLIQAESKVLRTTRSLPEESPQSRERLVLSTLEDQRDVAAIHFQFVDVLTDVATWEGDLGAGALKAIRLLKTLQIDKDLVRADKSLAAGQFPDAQSAEQAAIRGWQALLEVVEQTQGLAGSDRDTLAKLVAETIKQQEAVRDETKTVDPQDLQKTEQLAQRQHEIQQRLADLSEAVRSVPNTEALTEQAKAASIDAEAKLFEGSTTAAVQQQGQVIGALAEIGKRIEQSSEVTDDKTAEQLAQEVKKLEQLDQALDQIRSKQSEVAKKAAANAPSAKQLEDQVSQQLKQANEAADFGAAIETRLADAQDDVARAQTSLANAAPQMSEDRTDAAHEAAASIHRAAAEVKQELADARRVQLAVQLGEFARAAEALERAAAAERDVAAVTEAASKEDGVTAEQAAKLKQEHARVGEVTRSITDGVKSISPKTSEMLGAANSELQAVGQQLDVAAKSPGLPSKNAAGQAAQSAVKAAGRLEDAAKELRQQSAEVATKLAKLADEQLQPVRAVRGQVEKALGEVANQPVDSDPTTALRQALHTTRQAQVEQLRASGKIDAAAAQEIVQRVNEALQRQQVAESAVRDFVHGRTNSPLRAAGLEGHVEDLAREIASSAAASVGQELVVAAEAAEEAARELLVGNPNTAAAARQKTRDALQRAEQAAQKLAQEAAKQPAAAPDREAQQKVSDLAKVAAQQAATAAPDARASLEQAAQNSAAAMKALDDKQPPVAASAQSKATADLDQSATQLQQALKVATEKAQQQSEQLAKQSTELAEAAVKVDAGAAAALEQAAIAASQPPDAARPSTDRDQPTAEPKNGDGAEMNAESQALPAVTRGLEQATASLAAREQELQRDKDIAETLAQLVKDQQQARDQIAAEAEKLAEATPPDQPGDAQTMDDRAAERLESAQKLSDASDRFAEAQRATGEGAAEISGQEQVANPPIRKGLETASELGQLLPPPQLESWADADPQEPPATDLTADASRTPEDDARELGTGFVPQSPEETARRIAGRDALEEAARMMAEHRAAEPLEGDLAKSSTPQAAPNSQQPNDSDPTAAQQTQSARAGEAALAAKSGKNEELDPTQIEQAQNAKNRDSRAPTEAGNEELADRRFEDEPWFAKLPPSLQKAIQARSRRNAPRGYEERLKRYFESVD